MKQPPVFSTGDPSYLVAATTSGSESPTARTSSNRSVGACSPFFRLMVVTSELQLQWLIGKLVFEHERGTAPRRQPSSSKQPCRRGQNRHDDDGPSWTRLRAANERRSERGEGAQCEDANSD